MAVKTIIHNWQVTPRIAVEVRIPDKYNFNINLAMLMDGKEEVKCLLGTKELDSLITALQEVKELVDGKK